MNSPSRYHSNFTDSLSIPFVSKVLSVTVKVLPICAMPSIKTLPNGSKFLSVNLDNSEIGLIFPLKSINSASRIE